MAKIQKMRPLAFKLISGDFSGILSEIDKNCQKSQFLYLEKGVLKNRRAVMIKPRKIERSVFFYWTTSDKLEFTDWSEVTRDN